jgi:hypothetical protein
LDSSEFSAAPGREPGRTLIPSPAALLFASIALLVCGVRGFALVNSDGDLGRHLRVGEYILRSQSIPHTDLFSHTMLGQPFVPYEWLSEAAFALVFRVAGLPGVSVFCALMMATALTLVFLYMIRAGTDTLLSLIATLLAIMLTGIHWLARPHLFTILFAVLLVWLLQRADRKALIWSSVLFAFWANLHGGFTYGLILICLYLAGDVIGAQWTRARQHLIMLACSIAATIVNPAGIRLHQHVFGYLRNSYLVDHTLEYLSPNFHRPELQTFLFVLMVVLVVLAMSRQRVTPVTLLVLIVNTAFALYSARNIPLFAVTVIPLLAIHFDAEWRGYGSALLQRMRAAFELGQTRGNTAAWVGIFTIALIGLALNHGQLLGVPITQTSFSAEKFPVAAVQRGRTAQLQGRILNQFTWGGYLLHAWPEQKVFIDGQTDFYGADLTKTYQDIVQLNPGWRGLLDKWKIDLVVMPANSKLAAEIVANGRWELWYRDQTAVIIVRKAGSP